MNAKIKQVEPAKDTYEIEWVEGPDRNTNVVVASNKHTTRLHQPTYFPAGIEITHLPFVNRSLGNFLRVYSFWFMTKYSRYDNPDQCYYMTASNGDYYRIQLTPDFSFPSDKDELIGCSFRTDGTVVITNWAKNGTSRKVNKR